MGRSVDLPEELPDFVPSEHGGAPGVRLASAYATVLSADLDAADLPKQMCDGRRSLFLELAASPRSLAR